MQNPRFRTPVRRSPQHSRSSCRCVLPDRAWSSSRPHVPPTLSVGNVTELCLAVKDLLEFKLTMRHTLGSYLDAANFPVGNPTADLTGRRLGSGTSTRKRTRTGRASVGSWPARAMWAPSRSAGRPQRP
ncbi:hypothetical protein EMIT0347P_20650 [Pseudomonas sp. IT-347P]